MCSAAWEFINRPGKVFVMLGLMRVTSDIPVQIALKELLGRLFFLAKSPSAHKIYRRLQMTPHPNQSLSDIWIALNGTISFRMGNDYRITQPLEFVNRALVVFEVSLPCMRVEFEQKLVAPIEAQVWGPFFDTQLDELGVRHLKAHLQGKPIGVRLQLVKRIPHGIMVKIRIAAMRRTDNARNPRRLGSLKHLKAAGEIWSTVIDTGQNMTMNIPQGKSYPLQRLPPHIRCGGRQIDLLLLLRPRLNARNELSGGIRRHLCACLGNGL